MVIAIDGPSGVGKTTVARGVADALDLEYLDTGSTYRAATLAVLEQGVSPSDDAGVLAVLDGALIEYRNRAVYLDGVWVGEAVRSAEVTAAVSAVSAIPELRERIVTLQREWVHANGDRAVVEGRDIGTVVFPDASVKVFLTARPDVRAKRRAGDPEAAGRDFERVAAEMAARDHYDSTRETSPLQAAGDAVTIDSSELSVQHVVDRILELVAKAEFRKRHGPL